MSRKSEPLKKILELYRDLEPAQKQAVMAAMQVFSGEPTKAKRDAKPKPQEPKA